MRTVLEVTDNQGYLVARTLFTTVADAALVAMVELAKGNIVGMMNVDEDVALDIPQFDHRVHVTLQ